MSEQTLILLKPDAVERRLVGTIIARIESKGLELAAIKSGKATQDLCRKHYVDHVEKPFYPELESYFLSGPIVAMIVRGPKAVSVMRKLIGSTDGSEAAPGTIRGDYSLSREENLIHGSDSTASAQREIELFFGDDEDNGRELKTLNASTVNAV